MKIPVLAGTLEDPMDRSDIRRLVGFPLPTGSVESPVIIPRPMSDEVRHAQS